ncbi:hypothetical protein GXW77_14510 [Roseomonas alkaliterrae]|uniref:Uncharacterized protein n=1 Tax=Neoroseomonas alkaliterrae TaxID=1452450 RepID=A0A840XPK7_9PROT|nr:hypothetical protein [Neoroseomonas alkaliterrae]MBB5690495.1 hypothetical protein [Neoroseomonas alkaliterrae]MBR0677389.1 hypothetical protein [Neoroseomonas alkaliterrae]
MKDSKSVLAKWLRRRQAPSDTRAFRDFLGRQAAFIAQKTVIDYCRVKSGRSEQVLFADPDFRAALDHCRWEVFLAALADTAALAEGWLRPHAPGREPALAAALVGLHAAILAESLALAGRDQPAEAVPAAIAAHLARLQLAPPHPANTMPLAAEAPLLATLPIHPDQRRGEEPSILGALRFHVVTTQQEMERRFDAPATARLLLASSPDA